MSIPTALPATERPVIEHPVIEHPATEHPVIEHPATEHPVIEHPATEHPVIEHPATEHPVIENPAIEHPVIEHPTTEHPDRVLQDPARKRENSAQGFESSAREPENPTRERDARGLEDPTPVLQDLQWERLANELEDWLDAGHRPPLPAGLEARPAGLPSAHLEHRLTNLTTRLTAALREMATERSGLESSIRATAQAQRASAVTGGATPSYLDTGA